MCLFFLATKRKSGTFNYVTDYQITSVKKENLDLKKEEEEIKRKRLLSQLNRSCKVFRTLLPFFHNFTILN